MDALEVASLVAAAGIFLASLVWRPRVKTATQAVLGSVALTALLSVAVLRGTAVLAIALSVVHTAYVIGLVRSGGAVDSPTASRAN